MGGCTRIAKGGGSAAAHSGQVGAGRGRWDPSTTTHSCEASNPNNLTACRQRIKLALQLAQHALDAAKQGIAGGGTSAAFRGGATALRPASSSVTTSRGGLSGGSSSGSGRHGGSERDDANGAGGGGGRAGAGQGGGDEEEEEEDEVEGMMRRLLRSHPPPEVLKAAHREAKRLQQMGELLLTEGVFCEDALQDMLGLVLYTES